MNFKTYIMESSCPLDHPFGEMPGGGVYTPATLYSVQAQHIVEALHCILGSLSRIWKTVKDEESLDPDMEKHHIEEEIQTIQNAVRIGSGKEISPIYNKTAVEALHDARDEMKELSLENIPQGSQKLRRKAQNAAEQIKRSDVPPAILSAALSTYKAIVAFANAMERSIDRWPDKPTEQDNAFTDREFLDALNQMEMEVEKMFPLFL